jgi:hypothetical protein
MAPVSLKNAIPISDLTIPFAANLKHFNRPDTSIEPPLRLAEHIFYRPA